MYARTIEQAQTTLHIFGALSYTHGFEVAGEWRALRFQVSLRLATSAPAW
jgi:hypothetical protein